MSLVETLVVVRPAFASAPGSEEGGIVVADHERLIDPALQAEARQRTSRTVPGACAKEAAVLDPPAGTQGLAARAFDGVVPSIIAKAEKRHGALDRLGLVGIRASIRHRSRA